MDTRKGVLLIEDDSELRQVFAFLLESEQYRVYQADDGQEGLDVLSNHQSDIKLVITDLNLPKLGGVELIGRLRSQDPTLKLLGTSGFNSPSVRELVLGAGANAFVAKPYVLNDIVRQVRDLMEQP